MSHHTIKEYLERLADLLNPDKLPTMSKKDYVYISQYKYDIFILFALSGLGLVLVSVYVCKYPPLTSIFTWITSLSVVYCLNKIKKVRQVFYLYLNAYYLRYSKDKIERDLAWWGRVLHALDEIVKKGDQVEKLKAWNLLSKVGALSMLVRNRLGICVEGSSGAKAMQDVCVRLAEALGVEQNWHLENDPGDESAGALEATKAITVSKLVPVDPATPNDTGPDTISNGDRGFVNTVNHIDMFSGERRRSVRTSHAR